jgi:hypothetical protein
VGTDENIYEKLLEYLGLEESNINILEESIDTNVQLEYFEYSRNYAHTKSEDEILINKETIFDLNLPMPIKKSTLVELASLNNIEAYRTIERFVTTPDIKLFDWACLALQESRLHLESNLLDESKVLITTGLGGKGLKLRYFIVLFSPQGQELTEIQQNIIQKELLFYLPKYGAEVEDILFEDSFAQILAMIPIKVHLKKLFKKVIFESNQLGDFLFNDFIITNVKALHTEEIRELLRINNIY